LFAQHQPPQGYFHVRSDDEGAGLVDAALKLRELVGEFDKPKFFHYRPKICAHSRNEREGCTACIDVCSARAITSLREVNGLEKGGIAVNPNLCVGCGACTTVCPSGALGYATPTAAHQGAKLRTMLAAYAKAGGPKLAGGAALLLHSEGEGARLVGELGRAAGQGKVGVAGGPALRSEQPAPLRGLPARVLPVELFHTASIGLDLWLAAIAHGASQIWVLMTDEEAPEYREAVAAQMAVGQAILAGLGYEGQHLRLIHARDAAALDAALQAPPAQTVAQPAGFAVQADKRATLELAIDHLIAQAPAVRAELVEASRGTSTSSVRTDFIALPAAGSPFGSLAIDTAKCTLCLACVGACPASALGDNPDRPQLRFTEKNCVQCGLCVLTCPEDALALQPRLWLADAGKARKQPRVINEAQPYACIKCGKPFGTQKAIEGMLTKLVGHSMFQGAARERLKMCGDCRVIDLHTNPNEVRITDL
jgi:ferredoxin